MLTRTHPAQVRVPKSGLPIDAFGVHGRVTVVVVAVDDDVDVVAVVFRVSWLSTGCGVRLLELVVVSFGCVALSLKLLRFFYDAATAFALSFREAPEVARNRNAVRGETG